MQPLIESKKNISTLERALSAGLGGLALVRYGKSSVLGTVLAAGLLQRAATGHCSVYKAMGVDTHDPSTPTFARPSVTLTKAVTISADPETIFPFFSTQLERWVELSPEVVSIIRLDHQESDWSVKTPVGETTFRSHMISSEENRRIAWMCEDGHFPHSGEVVLEPSGRGTSVRISMEYRPPGGKPAATLGRLTGLEPHEALERALYNLRSHLEAGEIPIAEPQPVGAGKGSAQ